MKKHCMDNMKEEAVLLWNSGKDLQKEKRNYSGYRTFKKLPVESLMKT